jgi:Carboxypeptidase regulatory-like domain
MKGLNKFCFLSVLLVVLLGFLSAYAQVDYSTATLRGTVMDPQGAVVSGATVTVTNPGTGSTKTVKTLGDGSYRIPALPPGSYQITVEAPGFAKEVTKGVDVTVGSSVNYDFHLKVGTASETVEVSSDNVPLIQPEQTQQANTINQLQVQDLPNINHNITQAVYTLPGVANSDAPRAQQPGFTGFGTTGFSIGGSNGRNNLSTIDGGENEYGTGQYRLTTIPQDTIQEYQVNRNGFAAEFGFTDGSAINIVTKSGGNRFHGDVYGFFQNHNTSATNFFNGIEGLPAAYNQNLYTGFGVGGPIKKDKLFFFLAYEYRKLDSADFTNAGILTAPTVLGINAPGLGAGCTSSGSLTVNQLCYVNALATSGLPGAAQAATDLRQSLNPLSNPFLNSILTKENGIFIDPTRNHNTSLRFDAVPGASDTLTLKATYAHNDYPLGNPDGSSLFTRDFSILSTWNHTFTPSLLNQLLIQLVPRNVANSVPNGPYQGVNFSLGNLNVGNLGGTSTFGSPSLTPYLAHQRRYQFDDGVTWTHGPHTLKFGGQFHLADYHVEDDLWFNNEFDFHDGALPMILSPSVLLFGPARSGADQVAIATFDFVAQNILHLGNFGCNPANPAAPCVGPPGVNLSAPQSFNSGLPVDVLGGFNNAKWSGWGKYFGGYVQDTWKVNSRLTINGGVRLDNDSEPSPLGSSFYASPRVGLSWVPFGDQKTIIKAGGGIYTAPIDVLIPSYGSLLNGTGQYINEVLGILSATDPRVANLWGNGVALHILPFGNLTQAQFHALSACPPTQCPPTGIPGFDTTTPGALVAYGVAPNYKNPYTVQASLSIGRQLGNNYFVEAGYLMYHGVHLQMPLETGYAQVNPGNPLCATAFKAFPGCVDITGGPLYVPTSSQLQHTTYESIGSSIYHGLTGSFTKRYSHGLQFQVNYTWSKSIDNVIDFASFQNWFRPSMLNLFRAVSVFDIPHTLVANAVYTTPFKPGTGNFFHTILADISVAPILAWESGLPFSVRTPSLANGLALDSNYAMPFHSARDNNRGPAYTTTDVTLKKAFFIDRDRGVHLDLSATGTNIFNRVNFIKVSDQFDISGIPSSGIVQTADGPLNLFTGPYTGLHGVKPTSPGQITQPLFYSAAASPRQIQFGLKLVF